MTLRLLVPSEAAGERLDRFLAGVPEVGSRAAAERVLASVLVDGRPRPKSYRLEGGEEVAFEPPDTPRSDLEPEEMELRIAYEDEHLVVVDKPAGLVVHPAPGHATGTLVHGLLALGVAGESEYEESPGVSGAAGGAAPEGTVRPRAGLEGGVPPAASGGGGAGLRPAGAAAGQARGERPGIVHRLDRDTSGLLVVARSQEAHRRLQELVRERAVEREYLALVCGRPRSHAGRIEAAIGRDRRDPTRHSLDTNTPRDAVTHFEVLELLPAHALLRVTLETGRTHQIRVHLAAIDLPVAGDPVYGRTGELELERQFLHAARLAFPHPLTGKRVEARSPLPGDLQAALERARGPGVRPR